MIAALTPEQRTHVEANTRRWRDVFSVSRLRDEEQPNAFAYRMLNLPCPFLKDDRCMVYEHRPGDCRMFFALGNPEGCAMPARVHQPMADYPHPNPMDTVMERFFLTRSPAEIDHIGGHLVRKILGDAEFTTGAHRMVEIEIADAPTSP